jgi:hypothetical protein
MELKIYFDAPQTYIEVRKALDDLGDDWLVIPEIEDRGVTKWIPTPSGFSKSITLRKKDLKKIKKSLYQISLFLLKTIVSAGIGGAVATILSTEPSQQVSIKIERKVDVTVNIQYNGNVIYSGQSLDSSKLINEIKSKIEAEE